MSALIAVMLENIEVEASLTPMSVVVAMRCDDEREVGTRVDGVPETSVRLRVQRSRRLVEEHYGWVADQRTRKGELLHHPRGAVIDAFRQDRVELQFLVELRNLANRLRSRDAANAGCEQEVLPPGEPQVERALL